MTDIPHEPGANVPAAEVPDVELPHAHSWWAKYVFSQDAKYIAIQDSLTAIAIGMGALVLSWMIRLQLGFPGIFDFITTDFFTRNQGWIN